MSNIEDAVKSVLLKLDSETRNLNPGEYKEVLELLTDDIEVRLDAAKSEAVDDDDMEDSYEQNAIQGTSR